MVQRKYRSGQPLQYHRQSGRQTVEANEVKYFVKSQPFYRRNDIFTAKR